MMIVAVYAIGCRGNRPSSSHRRRHLPRRCAHASTRLVRRPNPRRRDETRRSRRPRRDASLPVPVRVWRAVRVTRLLPRRRSRRRRTRRLRPRRFESRRASARSRPSPRRIPRRVPRRTLRVPRRTRPSRRRRARVPPPLPRDLWHRHAARDPRSWRRFARAGRRISPATFEARAGPGPVSSLVRVRDRPFSVLRRLVRYPPRRLRVASRSRPRLRLRLRLRSRRRPRARFARRRVSSEAATSTISVRRSRPRGRRIPPRRRRPRRVRRRRRRRRRRVDDRRSRRR